MKKLLAGLCGLLATVGFATDYYVWKGTGEDSVTTYSKYNVATSAGADSGTAATGEIPSGSVVFIPNNKTYHVDDDTADFCGALGGLKPQGSGTVVELSLSNDHSFGCYIYGTASARVVKSGAGTLTLTADGTDLVASNRRMHYCASWRVEGGEVVFWPSATTATYNIQSITVGDGATVRLPPSKSVVFVPGFVSGGGTLAHATGGDTGTLIVAGSNKTAMFTGTITGNVKIQLRGNANFKTASSDFTGGVTALLQAGVRMPGDVLVVTMANRGNAMLAGVPHSQIEFDPDSMGDCVAKYVLACLDGRKASPKSSEVRFIADGLAPTPERATEKH